MASNSDSEEAQDLEELPSAAQPEAIARIEERRRLRAIVVPTADFEVRAALRILKLPITLFGEDRTSRRERLRRIYAERQQAGESVPTFGGEAKESESKQGEQEGEASTSKKEKIIWYHEGSDILHAARMWLAGYSLKRAAARHTEAEQLRALTSTQREAARLELHRQVATFYADSSQIGDESRPLTYCAFAPDSEHLATSSLSGVSRIWSIPRCELVHTLRAVSTVPTSCVEWHPDAYVRASPSSVNLISSTHDGAVKLWSLESEEPIADIDGHQPHRVSRVRFHPSGRFFATCCFDSSWRLWDMEALEEILHQEGHSRAVYDIAFHPDGSLALTGGMDAYGRVWDLRTGRCVMFLSGHCRGLLAVAMAPNGVHIATGSEDHSVRIWDLRARTALYTLPAHTHLVSGVRFQPACLSAYLLTSSYDTTVRIWSNPIWTPVGTPLRDHASRIMCMDLSSNGRYFATAGYDRTFKLWRTVASVKREPKVEIKPEVEEGVMESQSLADSAASSTA